MRNRVNITSVYFILIIFVLSYCGPKQEKVERIVKEGVEIIVNHLEPYKIKGERTSLSLEKEFSIDTERDEIAELGLTDISGFDVDSNGNIFLRDIPESDENHFFKFDNHGKFITSFGRNGQGPGEFGWANLPRINYQDEIMISDIFRRKLIFFDTYGNFTKEIQTDLNIGELKHLENGKLLIARRIRDLSIENDPHPISLFSQNLEEIKELDRFIFPGFRALKRDGTRMYIFTMSVSDKYIYIGNIERGYEVSVFDLEGNLVKKIRKKYRPLEVSKEYKTSYLALTPENMKEKISFTKYFPPFQYLFSDERGYLFVMTYEKGENPNEYIFDIFNPDGLFIGRTNLDNFGIRQFISKEAALDALTKQGRIYYIREKENGFKELVVCKMIWN